MGDVLMTSPAIRAIKETGPGRSVALLTSTRGAAAAQLIPEIDEVISYEAPWMKTSDSTYSRSQDWSLIRSLKAGEYDAAVIFTVYSQSPFPAAMICYLAEIPLRLAHSHENPYQLLSDWVQDPEPDRFIRHEVQRQIDLIGSVGIRASDTHIRIRLPEGAVERALAKASAAGFDPCRPWVVIHPGANAASRRYPTDGFTQVAEEILSDGLYQIVWTGSNSERELIGQIQHPLHRRSVSLAGKLNLEELAGFLKASPLLISNNTGPVHLAASVGTPVVDLYALTNPQHTPWGVPSRVLYHDVPCKYCYRSICPEGHHNCLQLVTPHQVVQAAYELLAETCTTLFPRMLPEIKGKDISP